MNFRAIVLGKSPEEFLNTGAATAIAMILWAIKMYGTEQVLKDLNDVSYDITKEIKGNEKLERSYSSLLKVLEDVKMELHLADKNPFQKNQN